MILKIISAAKVEFTGEVTLVKLPGALGEFTVLENHASLVAALRAGTVEYEQDGTRHTLSIAGGIADVDHNVVSVSIN